MSDATLESCAWRSEGLAEALFALAHAAGFRPRHHASLTSPRDAGRDPRSLGPWLDAAGDALSIDIEPVECPVSQLDATLASVGVAIVALRGADEVRYAALLGTDARGARLLAPSLAVHRIPIAEFAKRLLVIDERSAARVERWLQIARVPPRDAPGVRRKLLGHVLATERVDGIWLLRPHASAGFFRQIGRQGGAKRIAAFLAATIAQVGLGVLSWALIGRGALNGVVEPAWLLAWALVSLTSIVAQLFAGWAGGRVSIDVAALLKQRLLAGALQLDADEIRIRGSGQLLAMASESEAIETAGLSGALGAFSALIELASAALVLMTGPGGALQTVTLLAWTGLVAWLATRFVRRRAAWTRGRFALAESFVENVIGHRTRVAQQRARERHRWEDGALDVYADGSRAMDAAFEPLVAAPARGWLCVGLLGLLPAMVVARPDPTGIAIALAGLLQAQNAFTQLVSSLPPLLNAAVAWSGIAPLFRAAGVEPSPGLPELALTPSEDGASNAPVLETRGVSYRYRAGAEPALRQCDLTLFNGDRVLLEGPSGGGKSTFASVIAGVRQASTGLVLLRGLDRATVGASSWRRRVTSAPQFHENLILSGTLAFNLLMGRSWPASESDRRDAENVCRRLGLGPMLDRMPSGVDQIVGETGWQLSHGERSRVFLARALLQRSDVVFLDESFGALDPLTFRQCLDAVLTEAPTLVVIAHP